MPVQAVTRNTLIAGYRVPHEIVEHILTLLWDHPGYRRFYEPTCITTTNDSSKHSLPLNDVVNPQQRPTSGVQVHGSRVAPLFDTLNVLQPVLATIARVCRDWNRVSIPMLYGHIVVVGMKRLKKLLRSVRRNKALRGHVKSVWAISSPVDACVTTCNSVIQSLHAMCPHISAQSVKERSVFRKPARLPLRRVLHSCTFQGKKLRNLSSASAEDNVSALTHLELKRIIPPSTQCHRTLKVSTVRQLVLSDCILRVPPHDTVLSHISQDGLYNVLTWPPLAHLRHLQLFDSVVAQEYEFPQLPFLQSLEFVKCTLILPQTFFSSLARSAPTLQYLSIVTEPSRLLYGGLGDGDLEGFTVLEVLVIDMQLLCYMRGAGAGLPRSLRRLEIVDDDDCDLTSARSLQSNVQVLKDMFAETHTKLGFVRIFTPEAGYYRFWLSPADSDSDNRRGAKVDVVEVERRLFSSDEKPRSGRGSRVRIRIRGVVRNLNRLRLQ